MKTTTKRTLLTILVTIILGLGIWGVYTLAQPNDTTTTQQAQQVPATDPGEAVQQSRTEITYQATPGITSLEQLKQEAHTVVTSQSEYGELVESIEGHNNGVDGNYWSFYINGEMAQVGAGDYVQQEGDVITWKFQSL